MKIKINLFQKIFIFSIFLIIFTVTVSYLFSAFLADSLYLTKTKSKISEVARVAKKLSIDEYIFNDYVAELKNKEGINIYITSKSTVEDYTNYSNYYEDKDFYQAEEGFHIKQLPFSNVVLLIYREELPNDEILFITTSLSIMSNHRHEVYSLHLITFFLTMIISVFLCRFLQKNY